MSFNPDNYVWTELFRPTSVKDLVGKEIRERLLKYLEQPKQIPNFIFISTKPGLGKTSAMKAIINDLKCDKLILNSSDERGLETIRGKIKEFAKTKSLDGNKKCVALDEFDGMTMLAQDSLRNIMETYAGNIFFILTCNSVNRVAEPIRSRCININFSYPEKEEIKVYLEKICDIKNLDYLDEGLDKIIQLHYPSIRNMVLVLQDLWTNKKQIIPDNIAVYDKIFETLWIAIKNKDYKTVREKILSSDINVRDFNTYIWFKFIEEDNNSKLQICAQNELAFAYGADEKIIFATSLIELIK